MQEEYYADRARLRQLRTQHPDWRVCDFMVATRRSRSWVKKWLKRLKGAAPDDESVLRGLPPVAKHQPARLSELVVERILAIRDNPPENLQRVPGPKAIQYYLEKDSQLQATLGKRVRPSTRSIWRVLDQNGRIARFHPVEHQPLERPTPMSAWELDFKDISSVQPEPDGKRQHVLECLNVVDKGTSVVVSFRLHRDFNAQTVLEAIVSIFRECGLPVSVTMDRDVRFIGSATARDFPSALVRLLQCLGIEVIVCSPQAPQEKPFVERYNGTYDRECLKLQRPADQVQAQAVTERFVRHYNFERPHQGLSCANRPPRRAFPELPTLRQLPAFIDPDVWLEQIAGRPYVRRINRNGSIQINHRSYYVKRALAGHHVLIKVEAETGEFVVMQHQQVIKRLAIDGLQRHLMTFEAYFELMLSEAQSEWRHYLASHVIVHRVAA